VGELEVRPAGDVTDIGRRRADQAARAGDVIDIGRDVDGVQEILSVLVPTMAQLAQPDVPGRRR
jgi:hypothetical protein